MNQELLEVIKREEGTKKKDGIHIPYNCSEGKLTIGYGLLIDPEVSGGVLTDAQAEMLLSTTVDTMLVELYNIIPW